MVSLEGGRGWRQSRGSFKTSEQGVSPVISTILMVAVTVVLAATAFVLVADVGGQTTEPLPPIGFRVDDSADEIQVTDSSPNANWDRLKLRLVSDAGTGPVYVGTDDAGGYMNEPAANTGGDLSAGDVDLVDSSVGIAGADFLHFCRDSTDDGAVEIMILDTVANAQVAKYSFSGLEACV